MRVAALYDVHGMPWALEAVLDELADAAVDEIVFGGDLFLGPKTVELDGVLYCHASPRDDLRPILTDASPDERFEDALAGVENRLVVAGHTHMQFRRGRFVNAGSVGMPYEDDVAAFWAIVGDEVEFRRTAFDVERAIAEIAATAWPSRDEFVAENLRAAPSRKQATEHFESLD